ncbi:MAG: site-2 protease family protein [Myxococcaceae bacterium]
MQPRPAALTGTNASPAPATHEPPGFSLMQLFGIEVRLDWSLLIIFMLVAVNFGVGVLPRWHRDWPIAGIWALAIVAALAFFASLLAHELSHALVARRFGIEVKRITLFLFGGMAQLEEEPRTPISELLMAAAGPLASFAIGAIATIAGLALAGIRPAALADPDGLLEAVRASGPVAAVLLWLGPINLALGAFNLVPGFPLDGGRVLRALLWGSTGDLVRATRWAAGAGQAVGWLMMAYGVVQFFTGTFASGVWMVLIGWFLNNAARSSYQMTLMRHSLEEVSVTRVMRTHLDRITPGLSITELVRDHIMPSDQRAFPVEEHGALIGLVTFEDVRRVPQADWPVTRVDRVMTPLNRLTVLPPEARADQALDALARRDVEQIPITEGEHLLGLVRRQDLVRWISLH